MKHRAFASLSLSALMLGGSMVGCTDGSHVAAVGDVAPKQAKRADAAAASASGELAKGHADAAVALAEQAVAVRPRRADYRLMLGQSYLKAGRFISARQAFADTLALDPENGKAALNLAIVETGLGDWSGARATLDANARTIPAADRGLAVALAGDPGEAVRILTAAARSARGDVKTRQNLALALALAGHWPEARAVAATDLPPADVDQRMAQWASFARPTGAADQVAALLGVVPVMDAGQPVALALAPPTSPALSGPPVEPVRTAEVWNAPPAFALVAAPPLPVLPVAMVAPRLLRPVVQPLPVAPVPVRRIAATVPARHVAVASAPAKGIWYVQVGAYRNAAVAQDGWQRTLRRDAAFRGHLPEQATFRAASGVFYRLSVGGLSHGDAKAMCRSYRAHGGSCFVRAGAGDQIASWVRKDVQLASR